MSNTAYSELKAAWHTAEIERLRRGETFVPKQVQLILSDLCNQDCHFCAYRMSQGFTSEFFGGNPNRMIPFGKAVEILHDCHALGVRAIQFTGGGEPTVHPQHLELFHLGLSLGLECALVTNGALLRLGWEDILPRFRWIRVSVDASTAEEYARVRRVKPSIYERVLGNVRSLAYAIEHLGTDCLLGVGYVITRENWQDLPEGIARLRDTGASYVRLTAMFSKDYDGYYDGLDGSISGQIARVRELETERFRVVDLFGNRISDLKQHAPDYDLCGYQHFNVYVGGDLKVYRCCNTAYTPQGLVGDLSAMSFLQWFESEERKRKYLDFNARSCQVCQFNKINRVVSYLTQEEPLHVNFV